MESYRRSVARMGTVVTVEVVGHDESAARRAEREAAAQRALLWFGEVERACSRFDPTSELRRLSHRIGSPTRVSPLLFGALQFALALAEETGGAFDPTVGRHMESRGFDRHYLNGHRVEPVPGDGEGATYRDVHLDAATLGITLTRPIVLDLGAVAKGLAIDLAIRELADFDGYAVDAGGDLYLAGHNAAGEPWSVGIRHPRRPAENLQTLRVSGFAVCTSGDYERRAPRDGGSHILDPRSHVPAAAHGIVSVTTIAPSAMVADALCTAAFVLGPDHGIALLERHGVQGLLLTEELGIHATAGFHHEFLVEA
jgi:thiamine biosynthesis lipoprotein